MTNICRMSLPPPGNHAAHATATALAGAERRKPEQHPPLCASARHPLPPGLAHGPHRKTAASPPLPDNGAAGTVTGGVLVTYAVSDVRGDGPAQSGLLAHRARVGGPAGAASGVIPATSPLGATLVGMRAGQRAPLPCEDGTARTVIVLGVETLA